MNLSLLNPFRRKARAVRMELSQRMTLRYKMDVVRGGRTVRSTPWVANMLTDAGLDSVATRSSMLDGIMTVSLGTNAAPTPVRRDGGGITFTQAGTTLTASGAFFTAADVGRLFKYGVGTAGAEYYITGYTSATVVTVGTAATVGAATAGVIWYVNRNQLDTPLGGLTWAPEAGSSSTNSAVAGANCTLTHTFVTVSSALAAAQTIYEIGFGSTNGLNLFDRDVIAGGVGLLLGDQARVSVQLIIEYSPVTPLAFGNLATGYDSSGQFQWEGFYFSNNIGFSSLSAAGVVTGGSIEPSQVMSIYAVTGGVIAFNAFNINNASPARTRVLSSTGGYNVAYGSGNRYIDKGTVFQTADANATIYGFELGKNPLGVYGAYKLTTPFAKNNTQRLTVVFRMSWSRVLQN